MRKLHYNATRCGKPVAACVQDFIDRTTGSPEATQQELGKLADDNPDPAALKRLCLHFANGVQYVCHQFNAAPERIYFVDRIDNADGYVEGNILPEFGEDDDLASYLTDERSIRISRTWFMDMLLHPHKPYLIGVNSAHEVSREDMAFLAGVHEALHHAQEHAGSRAKRKGVLTLSLRDFDYNEDPTENEAWKYEINVAREVGILPKIRGRS